MKLTVQLTLNQIDPACVKGEDFDSEMETLLEGCEPEGWEVASVTIDRAAASRKRSSEAVEEIQRLFEALAAEMDPNAPSRINPSLPKSELVEHWRDILKKLLSR